MIVIDQPQDLSPDDEADLVLYVDGRLDADRRAGVEARAASDPSYAAALALQQQGREALVLAAEGTGAPLALRTRVEGLQAGRRHGDRRPEARTRLGGIRWPARGWWRGRSRSRWARWCWWAGARGSRTSRPPPCGRRRPPSPPSPRAPRCWTSASARSSSPTSSASSAGRRSGRGPTRSTAARRAPCSTRRAASGSPTRSSRARRSRSPTTRRAPRARARCCGR